MQRSSKDVIFRQAQLLVKSRPEPGAVELVVRPLPELRRDEVLVKVRYAGICGTDLHIVAWNSWAAKAYNPPVALGHEFVSEALAVGPGVQAIAVGDRVVAETHLACGACRQCRRSLGHICERLTTFSRLDRGAFATCTVVPAALLRRVPAVIADDVACVMEPLGIGIRAIADFMPSGGDVFVSGCGPIGLFTVAAAKALGAASIVASDLIAERRALALEVGATLAIDPGLGSFDDCVRKAADPRGISLTVETSGAGTAIASTLAATASAGTALLVGLPSGEVSLNLATDVIQREVRIAGLYGRHIDRTWIQMEDLLSSGQAGCHADYPDAVSADQLWRGARIGSARTRGQGPVRCPGSLNEAEPQTTLPPRAVRDSP